MPKNETFYMYLPEVKDPICSVTKAPDGTLGLEILCKELELLPISVWCYAKQDKWILNHEQTFRFIRERIEPSGRMNIDEILRNAGLDCYDEWMLFLYHHGKTVRDDLYIPLEAFEGTRYAVTHG
ncbi:MAG: hypothetical protein ACI4KM_11080 [Oscillospiraceae bacterium]